MVELTLPGIRPESEAFIRVAFCIGDDCTCWSDRSAGFTPPAFSAGFPEVPVGVRLLVEDEFRRSATSPKYSTPPFDVPDGDGLGAWPIYPGNFPLTGVVWVDGFAGVSAANGAKIYGNGTSPLHEDAAFMPANSTVCYGLPAENQHSFAEALISLDPDKDDDKYNFDIRHRVTFSGTTGEGYFVKVADGWWNALDAPRLFIGKFSGMLPDELARLELPTADATDKCDAAPPLTRAGGQQVWLRGEVLDAGNPLRPHVFATLAWGDAGLPCPPASGSLDDCPHVCKLDYLDVSGANKVGVSGQHGMFAHEENILVDVYRAGSE